MIIRRRYLTPEQKKIQEDEEKEKAKKLAWTKNLPVKPRIDEARAKAHVYSPSTTLAQTKVSIYEWPSGSSFGIAYKNEKARDKVLKNLEYRYNEKASLIEERPLEEMENVSVRQSLEKQLSHIAKSEDRAIITSGITGMVRKISHKHVKFSPRTKLFTASAWWRGKKPFITVFSKDPNDCEKRLQVEMQLEIRRALKAGEIPSGREALLSIERSGVIEKSLEETLPDALLGEAIDSISSHGRFVTKDYDPDKRDVVSSEKKIAAERRADTVKSDDLDEPEPDGSKDKPRISGHKLF